MDWHVLSSFREWKELQQPLHIFSEAQEVLFSSHPHNLGVTVQERFFNQVDLKQELR